MHLSIFSTDCHSRLAIRRPGSCDDVSRNRERWVAIGTVSGDRHWHLDWARLIARKVSNFHPFHSAKGLEFPVVAVTGLEEGLLPHFNSQDSPEDIEEERRLLYVGMTRAKERLLLSTCRRRRIAGRYQDQLESPFLAEIPAEGMVVHESPSLFAGARTDGVYRFFDRKNPRPYVEDPDQGALRKGCRVRHATLGVGVVLDLEGSGDDAKLTVFFDRSGKRRLVARYAALEVV